MEVLRGDVAEFDRDYAREKLLHATRVAFGPVLQVELRMTLHTDPARVARAFVEMTAIINGRPIRAHASAPTIHEATDAAAQRFTQRIERSQDQREAQHQRLNDRSAWHHADRAAADHPEPGTFVREPETRELRRRKQFVLDAETIDEAVLDLELLDHDFFLFENLETGEPNVVVREEDEYRLFQPHPDPEAIKGVIAPVVLDPATAPRCSVDAARELLSINGATRPPMLFFVNTDTDEGSVIYRRRDGHDGLIAAQRRSV